MASWYSKLLTTTTSQISNLQSKLLQGENDGDTEDDTHVCRVLRAYYTEEGKPFPGWLPPDPKAPPPVAPVYSQQQPAIGSRYGGLGQQQQQQTGVSTGSATGLSSLWDNSGSGRAGSAPQQPISLRQNQYSRGGGRGDVQSRPLPSQRAGSYQQNKQNSTYGRDSGNTPPPAGSSISSAQDKLKQRLWGGGGARTTSPSSGSSGPFQPPRQGGGGGYSSGNRGGGGGVDDYESRFAPGGMYDGSSSRGGGGGGGDKPFMGSNSPWSSGQDDFSGGGRPSRTGLPSGPRRGGLPSGPRMR